MAYKYSRYSDLFLERSYLPPVLLTFLTLHYEMINDGPPFVVRVKDDYLIRQDVISHIILQNKMIEVEVIKGREAFCKCLIKVKLLDCQDGWKGKAKEVMGKLESHLESLRCYFNSGLPPGNG